MILQDRIKILVELGKYIATNNDEWQEIKDRAARSNPWFAEVFVETSTKNIATAFLDEKLLKQWTENYGLQAEIGVPKNVGIVMAGNIPLVGFHDFLCVFISGHNITIKTSSKDDALIKHLVGKMFEWNNKLTHIISFAERLNGCDAYIATGSNNSSRYFEYYFGKYPSIIRKNRTSVAILTGDETKEELSLLADDIQQYFGLGCRNVTKLYVPEKYDFIPLMEALKKYEFYADFHKYKHNFDYHLALLIMGNKLYMNNGTIIFSTISRSCALSCSPGSESSKPHKCLGAALSTLSKVEGDMCIAVVWLACRMKSKPLDSHFFTCATNSSAVRS